MICVGLGSCIAVFVTDRIKKVSGGAHIPLPNGESTAELKSAGEIIDELLHKLQRKGGDVNRLRAKIAGGANVLDHTIDIGEQNASSIMELLRARKIYIAGSDLGGTVCRSVHFNSVTQELTVSTSEQNKYVI
jgi:chemotaxis protein CheD